MANQLTAQSKRKMVGLTEPYEIYCSVSQDAIIARLFYALNSAMTELRKTRQYEEAHQLLKTSDVIDEFLSKPQQFPIVSVSATIEEIAQQFPIAALSPTIDVSSAISYSQEAQPFLIAASSAISYSHKLIHWKNSAIAKLSHTISSAVDEAHPLQKLSHALVELAPGAELFYVRKHYKSAAAEDADRYARVCAAYIGPYETDRAGHDIYLSELQSRGRLVYITNPGIYQVPGIYQFEANRP